MFSKRRTRMKTKTAETVVKRLAILCADGRWGDRVVRSGGSKAVGVGGQVAGWRIPTDVRSLLLLVGYAAMLVIGVVNLFEGDLSGLVLVAAAIAGAFFVRG